MYITITNMQRDARGQAARRGASPPDFATMSSASSAKCFFLHAGHMLFFFVLFLAKCIFLLRAWTNDPHESRPHQREGALRILKPNNLLGMFLTTSQQATARDLGVSTKCNNNNNNNQPNTNHSTTTTNNNNNTIDNEHDNNNNAISDSSNSNTTNHNITNLFCRTGGDHVGGARDETRLTTQLFNTRWTHEKHMGFVKTVFSTIDWYLDELTLAGQSNSTTSNNTGELSRGFASNKYILGHTMRIYKNCSGHMHRNITHFDAPAVSPAT